MKHKTIGLVGRNETQKNKGQRDNGIVRAKGVKIRREKRRKDAQETTLTDKGDRIRI
jgi:hypothetical protein